MPTYDYICEACGHAMEVFHSMTESPMVMCPDCKETAMKKQIGTGAGIIFKGGGFYETDFKTKSGTPDKAEADSAKDGKDATPAEKSQSTQASTAEKPASEKPSTATSSKDKPAAGTKPAKTEAPAS